MARHTGVVEPSAQQLRQHYLVEVALADRLRRAAKQERAALYPSLYRELFRLVPDHPQLRPESPAEVAGRIGRQAAMLRHYLRPGMSYLEVGAGDGLVAAEVAGTAGAVTIVEVAAEVVSPELPPKVNLMIAESADVPVPPASADLAYSHHLLEHLHPEDALDHLQGVCRALRPGGVYLCVTPHALAGPHDISRHFGDTPRGLHLKEYTLRELASLLRGAGFRSLHILIGARYRYVRAPLAPVLLLEALLQCLPGRWGRAIARCRALAPLLGIRLAGVKRQERGHPPAG